MSALSDLGVMLTSNTEGEELRARVVKEMTNKIIKEINDMIIYYQPMSCPFFSIAITQMKEPWEIDIVTGEFV